jgi:hypothetical protein
MAINKRLINTQAGGVIPTDLAAWYKLDGNANDSSGNGYNGTPSNITYTTGQFGQAASFNGTNSGITISDTADLRLTGDYTISLWLNVSSMGTIQRPINKDDANDFSAGYAFVVETNGDLSWVHNDGSTNQIWATGVSLSANTWYNITCVYSDSLNLRTIYLNGVSQNTRATNTNVAAGTETLNLGYLQVYGQRLNGLLDQVRIYNIALDSAQVLALYNE